MKMAMDSIREEKAAGIVFPPTPPPEDKPLPCAQAPVQAFPASAPVPVPVPGAQAWLPDTPPVTPERSPGPLRQKGDDAALLRALFPGIPPDVLRGAQGVTVAAEGMAASFEGVVLDKDGARTLYVDGGRAEGVSLRESVVALLDLASERLSCTALVIALRRSHPALGALLHALMYVGGTVVTRPPFPAARDWVLVGVEI